MGQEGLFHQEKNKKENGESVAQKESRMNGITLESLKHYLKNAVLNAKQVVACIDNHASEETLRQEANRLIGFLEGGYDFIACAEEAKK